MYPQLMSKRARQLGQGLKALSSTAGRLTPFNYCAETLFQLNFLFSLLQGKWTEVTIATTSHLKTRL